VARHVDERTVLAALTYDSRFDIPCLEAALQANVGVRSSRHTDMTPSQPSDIAGIVLAAGAGTRYGQPKAAAFVDGERLVDRAVRCLRDGGCGRVLVVLGAWVGEVPGAEIVINALWAQGMGTSLRAGFESAGSVGGVTHAVITLVDLPQMTADIVRRVIAEPADIVVATYSGERRHPVKIARRHWASAADGPGDEGARRFLLGRSDVVELEIDDKAAGVDLDFIR
jgi:CTP:molybdopterin cytidylyltransferase MocA